MPYDDNETIYDGLMKAKKEDAYLRADDILFEAKKICNEYNKISIKDFGLESESLKTWLKEKNKPRTPRRVQEWQPLLLVAAVLNLSFNQLITLLAFHTIPLNNDETFCKHVINHEDKEAWHYLLDINDCDDNEARKNAVETIILNTWYPNEITSIPRRNKLVIVESIAGIAVTVITIATIIFGLFQDGIRPERFLSPDKISQLVTAAKNGTISDLLGISPERITVEYYPLELSHYYERDGLLIAEIKNFGDEAITLYEWKLEVNHSSFRGICDGFRIKIDPRNSYIIQIDDNNHSWFYSCQQSDIDTNDCVSLLIIKEETITLRSIYNCF